MADNSVEDSEMCGRLTAEEMDIMRKENVAYEYLCRLEEAKVWIEACIKEEIPPSVELEENLRNGVVLAKLAHFISPDRIPFKKIYDLDLSKYQSRGLHFRHTDNINHWIKSMKEIGLPENFYPETTDIYDRKNIPRLIYCLHALSLYMFKIGRAPQIQDLYGKIQFTDEEISNMRKELDKYGISMPAFSKIGGILANEMPVDEAALHAAVIAINSAIDKEDPHLTLEALQNPSAHIMNINGQLADNYQQLLYDAKFVKAENARNKSLNIDNVPDVYDELLTQAEIQGNINMANNTYHLSIINEMISREDSAGLVRALKSSNLNFRDVDETRGDCYLFKFIEIREAGKGDDFLTKDQLQQGILRTNEEFNDMLLVKESLRKINEVLEGNDYDATLQLLQQPKLRLPTEYPTAKCLYHEELKCMKHEKQKLVFALSSPSFCHYVKTLFLNAIAKVNETVDSNDPRGLLDALNFEHAHISDVDADLIDKYLKYLKKLKQSRSKSTFDLLTHHDIVKCINDINYRSAIEHERIEAVARINEMIDRNDVHLLLSCLQASNAGIKNVHEDGVVHYMQLLKIAKQKKAEETEDSTAMLWYEEIQDTIHYANVDLKEAEQLSACVAAVNISVENEDDKNMLTYLQHPSVRLNHISANLSKAYAACLRDFKAQKECAGDTGSGWMMNKLSNGSKYFFNINTMEGSWKKESNIVKDYSLLTRDDIENCVAEVNKSSARHSLFKASEHYIIQLQAHIKGAMVRRRFLRRKKLLLSQTPAVKAIQHWWRRVKATKEMRRKMNYYSDNEHSVVQAQALTRMYLTRKAYQERLNYFKKHVSGIVKIQAFMRTARARQDYKALMHGDNSSVSVIRKFVHLLDITDQDYNEEIELDKLRHQVVQEIRSNQQLDQDLNQMDVKIGLLVKNRITLQDVVSQNKFLRQYQSNASVGSGTGTLGPANNLLTGGLKGLSKASHDKLEAYQHLFYLLQTKPHYLAKLMFELPQSKTTKFMETAVLSLYNYASNQRDEYMLLGLFKTALEEEIRSKVTSLSDIITGNPMVIKMIVSFNRNARGQSLLKELLNPMVIEILEDKNLKINTNVVEVYKQWVNQTEATTGKPSGLPYDVSIEQALKHEEVGMKLSDTILVLQQCTEKFLGAILMSIDKIPYGMRYMSKVLKNALHARFPEAQEKEILKIIGNLIYYRYINSAIVAPDAFDIIEVAANQGLTNEQRRNLGSVAKILQFAASNKGFGSDSPHLVSMNKYIMDAHARFKRYFQEICEVDEPDVVFNIDRYSDVARIIKPVIYISVGEIVDLHKLLLVHQHVIAPDPHDPLHELLDDLGDVADVDAILGDASCDEVARQQMAKTEISLMLSNKFELPDDDQLNIQTTMLRTKQMIVDVLRCQKSGDNLIQVLNCRATEAEENVHAALLRARDRVEQRGTRSNLIRQQSVAGGIKLPIEPMKGVIRENLDKLEKAGMVSKENAYQNIVQSILQDVRNQRLHRQRRKAEMARLRQTMKNLDQKRAFFEEQINYYNQYVKTCLSKQAAKARKKTSVKYSALRLHEKGVLLAIEGLQQNQFKNVLFEIVSTDMPGLFIVHAKFMGVNMEKVELHFQNLLELQYEGIAVMKMFDRAQVNVNLLIYLLNHKFYGKK
ncbi:hypothetical protein HELRODRAFT_108462 [Helobdella robusta]|uniref:Ras GTPase-activating-like protein IQGAP1 n=1 Tax=Helobdella robusta TaxID=6412 RepID=T1EEJ2_HELRO|nr:hypothetical protein HELRODRAFT_108462 [Helobdella robusta]ESN91702.1 hypothetical protein HELRODRAFT_108462 [Helobdella robusta]